MNIVFSLISVLFAIFISIRGERKQSFINLVIYLVVFDLVFNRAGIMIGSSPMYCSTIIRLILLVNTIPFFLFTNNKLDSKLFNRIILLCFLLCLGMLYNILIPYDKPIIAELGDWNAYVAGLITMEYVEFPLFKAIIQYVGIVTFLLTLYILKTFYTKEENFSAMERSFQYLKILPLFGMLEFILKNVLSKPELPYQITDSLFGDMPTNLRNASYRGDFYSLQGLQEESSMFVEHLFIMAVIVFLIIKIRPTSKKKSTYLWLVIILSLMLLSGGFSAVWYFIMLLLIALCLKSNAYNISLKKGMKLVLTIILVCLIIIYIVSEYVESFSPYLAERLDITWYVFTNIINTGADSLPAVDESSYARFVSIIKVFSSFCDRPLLGLGLSYYTAHDVTVTFLSNFGLLGVIVWTLCMTYKKSHNIKYDWPFIIIFIFLSGLAMGEANIYTRCVYFILIIESTTLYTTDIHGDVDDRKRNVSSLD